jgi:hypothetical protein
MPAGIVKGSEHALTCPEGVLDRPNYLNLPHRSNPNFANQRGILYDIFEIYTKTKRQRRHHDVADRYDLLSLLNHVMSQYMPKQNTCNTEGLAEPEVPWQTDRLPVCIIPANVSCP